MYLHRVIVHSGQPKDPIYVTPGLCVSFIFVKQIKEQREREGQVTTFVIVLCNGDERHWELPQKNGRITNTLHNQNTP